MKGRSAHEALAARLGSDAVVAFGALEVRTGQDLQRDVAAVAAALPAGEPGAQVLIVIRADRYALVVALLATWQRGYVAALPPEHDREAITALAQQSVSVLHDTASGAALRIGPLLDAARADQPAPVQPRSWSGVGLGRLYQRGGDGGLFSATSDEAWLERAHALAEELKLGVGQRCATTVGMGHPHGLLLGALAPLLSGAAFLREPLTEAALQDPRFPLDLLVSVPAQLSSWVKVDGVNRSRVGRVLSALDALPPELSQAVGQQFGAKVEDRCDLARLWPVLSAGEQSEAASPQDKALLAQVRASAGVQDAAVIALSGLDRPTRCVAVVGPAPGAPGADAFQLADLRASVARQDARAELMAVREIRRDALGRFQRSPLLRLFRRRTDGSAMCAALTWGETRESANGQVREHRASVCIPTDYPYFDGHFPGYPILPGAAQLSELVLPLVRRVRPDLGRLQAMSRLKFSGRIQPGETIDVLLQGRAGDGQLDFTLQRGRTLCAAGSLSFASGDEPPP